MNRIKKRSVGTYTFTATAEDENGSPLTITAPVTVTIRDGAGTVVVTDVPVISAGKLVYDANAALMPKLDTYQLTWTGVAGGESQSWVTEVELVGGYLFEIADLRAQDRAFTDSNKYPIEYLRQARNTVETVIESEKAANVAFVRRGRRVKVNGGSRSVNGLYGLDLPDFEVAKVYSVKVDGVALTDAQVAAIICDDNTIWSADTRWPSGKRNVEIHYEHGMERVPPAITRAGLLLAREYLVKSDVPGRATATSIGDQWFRITVAGRDGVTGLPDVDAAIEAEGRRGYKVG